MSQLARFRPSIPLPETRPSLKISSSKGGGLLATKPQLLRAEKEKEVMPFAEAEADHSDDDEVFNLRKNREKRFEGLM